MPQLQSYPIKMIQLELSQPLKLITGLSRYQRIQGLVCWHGHPFGYVHLPIADGQCSIAVIKAEIKREYQDCILDYLEQHQILNKSAAQGFELAWLQSLPKPEKRKLPDHVSVSVVIATHSRPEELQRCLTALMKQVTQRKVEVIVVDNSDGDSRSAAVVNSFSGIRLITESRQGLSYARNTGILASSGQIIATIDDDVVVPTDWLEKLIQPFCCSEVMAVTGNVIPLEIETESQYLFENYGEGGLSHGFTTFKVGRDWLNSFRWHAPCTWRLGSTANAAFRTEVFHEPDIGLMEETLGTGMPTGAGEDIYQFYKVLRAGHTLIYHPDAFVWHRHRNTLVALKRQLYYYSRGTVAYQMTVLKNYGDLRGLSTVLVGSPIWYGQRLLAIALDRIPYRTELLTAEILGYLSGLWALWVTSRRVSRWGRSKNTSSTPIANIKRA